MYVFVRFDNLLGYLQKKKKVKNIKRMCSTGKDMSKRISGS